MNIRRFRPADYPAIAEIWNAAYPMYPSHVDEIREADDRRPARVRWRRFLLEEGGQALGFGVFSNARDSFDAKQFWLTLALRPELLGRGHGRTLYRWLLAELAPFRPTALFSWAREDMPRALRFFRERGFEETMRSFESVLDVALFDPGPFRANAAQLATAGIEIRDLNELERDPDYRRKLFELHTEIDMDVPQIGSYSKPSFEEFCEAHFNDHLLKDGMLVATQDGHYLGMCEIYRSKASDDLHNGLTGVRRPWRRKGVALGLKLASIEVARRYGVPAIRTWNASHNHGMLAINDRLGFVRQPATLDYRKLMANVGTGQG